MKRLKVLVLHNLGNPAAAPAFLSNHLWALRNSCPEHHYVYHDIGVDSPGGLGGIDFDAVILDVTLLWARWAEDNRLERIKRDYQFIKDLPAVKIALPQDEYDCNEILDDWLCEWNVDLVFSVIDGNWDVLYPKYSKIGTIRLAYTGYIDDSLLRVRPVPWNDRPIEIGYRARKLPPYFGSLGETKWRIGLEVKRLADRAGVVTDIVVGDGGALLGDSWLKFINECRFSLGANSGSSLLDPVGAIQRSVRAYMAEHPRAPFDEVERNCFPGLDRIHEFTAISPRVLEAGMLESCQILVEGNYSGILKPWEHYIPIKPDASDFDTVLRAMRDRALCAELVANCKTTLLDFKGLRYESYARSIIDAVFEMAGRYPKRNRAQSDSDKSDEISIEADASGKPNILLLVAHEPERDPRLGWIARSASATCVVHQLGVSRVPDAPQTEQGSRDEGFVWTIPHGGRFDDLGVLKELISGTQEGEVYLEVASLISLRLLDDRQLQGLLACGDSPRLYQFKWNVSYILDIAYTLVRFGNNLTGIDAIIATDLDTLLAGALLKERFGVPLIYDAHEFWPAADVHQANFEEHFWTSLEKRLVAYCDYAQTVTPGLAAHMSRLYGVTFFSTPNAEPLSARPQSLPEKNRTTNQCACRFLFQGGFAPARGIDILINIWPRTHPDAILVLRGPDNEYRHEMIRLAKSLGLFGNRVIFAPSVSESELVLAAVDFDVGLIPYTPTGMNYANCCPNKLSQYMAAGLPILACRTSFVEQVVENAGAGTVVNFADTDCLVQAVDRLVCDTDFRLRSGRSSVDCFLDSFHWEVLSRPFIARLSMLAKLSHQRKREQFAQVVRTPLFSVVEVPPLPHELPPGKLRRIWRRLPNGVRYRLGPTIRRFVERLRLALR